MNFVIYKRKRKIEIENECCVSENVEDPPKPLANGSRTAPTVPYQNRKPVRCFLLHPVFISRNQYDLPKTRSSFPAFFYSFIFYFFNFNPKKHQIDFRGPHSTHMWRFDRTLTPHRACHAPLSSFLYFCTHLHASSPPPVHLFWPSSSQMTFLPSALCPTLMVKITREPKLFLTKDTHPNEGCAPPPQ